MALLAFTGGIEGASLRGPSGFEKERVTTIDRANASFDAVSQFLDGFEINDDSIGRIEKIAVTMKNMGPVLKEMRDSMFEEDADADEWRALDNIVDRYNSLVGVVADKLEESAAFVEREEEDDSERSDVLENVNTLFDAVSKALDDAEVSKIEEIAKRMNEMGPLLEQMNGEMRDRDASVDLWDIYRSTLTRYSSLMESIKDKLESSYALADAKDENSEEEKEEDGLVEALTFAKEAMDNAEGMEDLKEVKDILDYVNNHLEGMDGEVKNKFEEVTGAFAMELNEKISSFEVPDLASGDERATALEKVNTSLDAVYQFLDDAEMNEESNEKMKRIAATLKEIGSALTEMRDEMFEGDADQWRFYGSTLERFNAVTEAVVDKLEVSAASEEAKNEGSEEEIESDDLVKVLWSVKGAIDGARSENDLIKSEDALRYVSGHLEGVDEAVKSKFEGVAEALYMLLNEKRASFEEEDEHHDA